MRDDEYLRALLEQNSAMGRHQPMGMPDSPYGDMGQSPIRRQSMPAASYGRSNTGKGSGRSGTSKMGSVNIVGISFTLVALGLGSLAWLFGARYTIDGTIWIVNLALEAVSEGYRLETGRNLYLGMMAIPIIFSMVEWGMGKRIMRSEWETRILWFSVVAIDLLTTGFGVAAINPGNSEIMAWIVGNFLPIIGITFFLTFWPEWILKWGWRKLRGGLSIITEM